MNFETVIVHRIEEIDPQVWDRLNQGQPFASHAWYRFGEKVLSNTSPIYILIKTGTEWIARASFWLTDDEPLPVQSGLLRNGLAAALARWPLLICRSPLAETSGLALPEPPLRGPAMAAIAAAARDSLRKGRGSFLLFDYLDGAQASWADWPAWLLPASFTDPGTVLDITWDTYEAYLKSLAHSTRRNYRNHLSEADASAISVQVLKRVTAIDEALPLIRNVELRHDAAPRPWARALLERVHEVPSIWIEARAGGRLVGCALLFGEGQARIATLLGLDYSVPGVYFRIFYSIIMAAIESGARRLYAGSGAYEFKRRLGFQLQDRTCVYFAGRPGPLHAIARLAAARSY
jgi:hypothetical protein